MKKYTLIAILIFFATYQVTSLAEGSECKFQDSDNYKTTFSSIKQTGMVTSERLCALFNNLSVSNNEIDSVLEDYVSNYESVIREKFPENDFPGITQFLAGTRNYLVIDDIAYKTLADFKVDRAEEGDFEGVKEGSVIFYYADLEKNKLVIDPSKDVVCKTIINGKNCLVVFKDLSNALNTYRQSYVQYVTSTNLASITRIQEKWDSFLTGGRSQTFLDVMVTSFINKGYYKDKKLKAPHPVQYFFMHPSIVYEHLNDTSRGKRDEMALSLELFGVNWWDLDIPFGVSAGWVYSDRENASSVGKSLMIHVKNQFSFGYTWRDKEDGGDGVFVSIDLLKLFEDKKEMLGKYQEKLFKSESQ